jgi:hypothetical protein
MVAREPVNFSEKRREIGFRASANLLKAMNFDPTGRGSV